MHKKFLAMALLVVFLASYASAGDLVTNSISYEPAPASPGSIVTVWAQIKNDSQYDAEDSIVRIETEFPLSLQPGEESERNIGVIKAFKTATVEFKLVVDETATDGKHSVKILTGESFPSRERSFIINIVSRTPKLEIIESDFTELRPGAVQPVTVRIKNIGGSLAKDIVLKVNPERTVTSTGVVVEREIVSLGAVSSHIAALDQGEEEIVQLTLAVNQDATLKNYSVPITMEYYDMNGTAKTSTGYLGIKVSAEADVDAVVNSVSPKAFPGGTSELVIDLFNVGLADARYVVIELSGNGMAIAEPKQFIGTLEADDFDSFKTEVSFDPTIAMGEQPLQMKIIYKDEELNEKVLTKDLTVKVVNPAEAVEGQTGLLVVFGLIGLALQLIGLYVVVKKAWPRVKGLLGRRQ